MLQNWPVIWLNEVDSTNNYANLLLTENKINSETVISAYSQIKGRGQKGNFWDSEPKLNLTFTLILFSKFLPVQQQFSLSQSVSLAIKDTLSIFDIVSKVKWPNDILVNDKKIAGILIENAIMGSDFSHSFIGIGLNVNQENFSDYLPKALSMKNVSGLVYHTKEVLNVLLDKLYTRIEQIKQNDFKNLKKEYLLNLYQLNEWHEYKTKDKLLQGKIVDIGENGELAILSDNNEINLYMFKEIEFL